MEDFKKITHVKSAPHNALLIFGILVFIIGTFTLNTFIASLELEVIFLILTIAIFIIYYFIQNKGLIIYKFELMWLVFFIYFIFNFLYQSNFEKLIFVDILVFFVILLFLILVKLDIDYYKIAINTILIIAVIYAISALFQYFNINLYARLILPWFDTWQQKEVMHLYDNNVYTGFTSQTAHLAGYLVYGIGVLFLFFKKRNSKVSIGLSILALILLFSALLLTGKRAHLLFMIISLVFTYLFSTELKKFFLQSLKLIFKLIIITIAGITLFKVYKPNKDTPIIGIIYHKMNDTIEGFIDGEDVTSGRTQLYDYAFKLFNETPILGIGWREFKQLSGGIINSNQGSHPHNIYFQLLTELGIIGIILFAIPVIYILIKTIKLLMNAELLFSFDMRWKAGLQFSLYSQMFFLLYGITGNLLTDHTYILMWGFSASITLSSIKYAKRQVKLNKLNE